MKLESNIKKYYAYNFFIWFSFFLPIFILYFLDKGLSYSQILFFTVVIGVTQLVFEIPSGVFADYFGRKNSLIISAVAKTLTMVLIFISNNFYVLILSHVAFGICLAFNSGSSTAFIFDTLKQLKREKEYKKIEGKAYALQSTALATGALFGGFLATISLDLPVLFCVFSFSVSIFIAISFTEPKHYKKLQDKKYFKHTTDAISFTLKHSKIRYLAIFSGLIFCVMIISHKFFQPYMLDANLELKYFGMVYFVFLMVAATASHFAYKIEYKIGQFRSLLFIPIILFIHFFIMSKFISIYFIPLIVLGEFIWGFFAPIIRDHINRYVDSHHRATVLSVAGFFQSILLIIFAPIFGIITDVWHYTTSLFVLCIITLFLGVPLVIIISKTKR
jgi:MFS family permease